MKSNISSLQKVLFTLFLFCLVVFMLIVGKGFLEPVAWALLISIASLRFLEKVHKKVKINWGVLIIIHLFFLLLIIIGILFFLMTEVREIVLNSPDLNDKLSKINDILLAWLSKWGVNTGDLFNVKALLERLSHISAYLFQMAGNVGQIFSTVFLVIIYSFFILFYKDNVTRFLHMKYQDDKRLQKIDNMVRNSISIVSSFLSGTLIMTLLMAVMIYFSLLLLGIKYALFWSVFAALLNLIPYIGNAIAVVMVVGYTFLTKEGPLYPVLVLVALGLANVVQENVLRPWIVGDRLKLNALTVFISVIAGSMIWGVSGMILFIPLAGIIKIMLENKENTRPYSIFFGEPKDND